MMRIWKLWQLVFMGLLSVAVNAGEPAADGAKGTATSEPPSESQQEARTLLMKMAAFLAEQKAFSVKVRAGYDVVQDSGQKIEFLETREVALARPDRLRVEETGGDGRGISIVFDGAKMTVADGGFGVYAQADQPGSVDDAIVYFVRDLGLRLPLAPLLTTRLPAELEHRVKTIDYVEMADILGQPAHHLAARTAVLDFQVWIADGARPLPLRIVLTYADEGRPQYWAQFSDWNLKPQFSDAAFAFKAPADSRQVPFAVQIPANFGNSQGGDASPQEVKP